VTVKVLEAVRLTSRRLVLKTELGWLLVVESRRRSNLQSPASECLAH
jgi:hypothetical protein